MVRERGPARRLWPGLTELGIAFVGFVIGRLLAQVVFAPFGMGPWVFLAGPFGTAVAVAFYAKVGPLWGDVRGGEAVERGRLRAAGGDASGSSGVGGDRRLAWGWTAVLVLLGVVGAIGGSVVLAEISSWLGLEVSEQPVVVEIASDVRAHGIGADAIVLAVSALIFAPLFEEWLFRRLLFVRIAACSGRLAAYVITAAGFAISHLNFAGMPVYFWLGVVFALVMERSGRWSAAVAVHVANNAFVLAALFWG